MAIEKYDIDEQLKKAIDKKMPNGPEGDVDAVKEALQSGANGNCDLGYPLRQAVEHNNVPLARLLVEQYGLEVQFAEGTLKRLVQQHQEESQEMLSFLVSSKAKAGDVFKEKSFIAKLQDAIIGCLDDITGPAKQFREVFLPSLLETAAKREVSASLAV